jgi:probable rRNA maturation factor
MDSDGPSTVDVTIEAPAWRAVAGDAEQLCRQAIRATLGRAALTAWLASAEVSVLLADDATVRRLNARYRQQDRATNVLSFPALKLDPDQAPPAPGPAPVLLGDIVLAAETVCAEAAAERKPPADHLRHLMVHGCLHLLGYDHQDAAGAARMERLERAILGELGIPDPYAPEPGAECADRALLEAGA